MPSLQTKALVATPISGDNFRIIPPNYTVSQACAPIKLNFPFCERKPLFYALSNVYQTDVWSVRCIRCHSHCKEQSHYLNSIAINIDQQLASGNLTVFKSNVASLFPNSMQLYHRTMIFVSQTLKFFFFWIKRVFVQCCKEGVKYVITVDNN